MFVGNVSARDLDDGTARYRQLSYTCLDTFGTRGPELVAFPNRTCTEGLMTSLRFPMVCRVLELNPSEIS
jgi:hypothetical protein